MADLLSTAISGLRAARVELDTVGHNIANVDTPGYSRQTVQLNTNPAQNEGAYSIGTGVDVTSIERQYNQYLTSSVRNQNALLQGATTLNTFTNDTNNLFSGDSNLQTALSGFYGSVQDVANDPSSLPVRQALLGKAQSVVSTFHTLDQQLGLQWTQVNRQVSGDVSAINGLAKSIAEFNNQIVAAYGSGTTPNDLLDQRDAALQKLSADVGVSVVTEGHSVDVSIGTGQLLVEGANVSPLKAVSNPYDPSQTDVTTAAGVDITGQISGGDLGGLLAFRSTVLTPTRDGLGASAVAFAGAVNAQHEKGMDLNGNLGGPLFTMPAPQAVPATGNTGSATMAASITNVGALTGNNYVLTYDGSAWSARTTAGQAVAMSGTGASSDPLVFGGVSLVVGGTATAGDSFEVLPTRGAAGGVQLAISDPNKLAMAAPIKATAATANSGAASVAGVQVEDPTNASLLTTAQITFGAGNTYSINGGASQAFTGGAITANGWTLTLSGTPAVGDVFTVSSNAGANGDNTNALALGNTATLGVLDGGTESAGAAYAAMVAANGDIGQQAQTQMQTETSLYQQATKAQQSVSGVSMDQAAAALVQDQQFYQASAQVIAAANTVFNSLLNAIR